MTLDEKKQFVTNLCDSVRDDVLGKIQHMPDEWDGIELREYLATAMERGASNHLRRKDNRKRLRNYRSECATRFGL